MRRPVEPRLRWDGSDQAHPLTFGESAQRAMEAMSRFVAQFALYDEGDLSRRERIEYRLWETFYAIRDGVPWAGHWEPVLWACLFAVFFVLFASLAAWPYRAWPW